MGPSESSSKMLEQKDGSQSARLSLPLKSSSASKTSTNSSPKSFNQQIPILPALPGYNNGNNNASSNDTSSRNGNGSRNRLTKSNAQATSASGSGRKGSKSSQSHQSSKKRGGHDSSSASLNRSKLRKGKWTVEEEEFTSRIIHHLSVGTLSLPEGMTLRSYLAEKLSCDPMRITKKFAGASCLGKYMGGLMGASGSAANQRPPMTSVDVDSAKAELLQLEHRFRMRVEHGQSGCLGAAAQAHAIAAAQAVEQAAAYRTMTQSAPQQQQHASGVHINASNLGKSSNNANMTCNASHPHLQQQSFPIPGVVVDKQSQTEQQSQQQHQRQLPFNSNTGGVPIAPALMLPLQLQQQLFQECNKDVGNGNSSDNFGGIATPQSQSTISHAAYASSELSASLQRALQGSNSQQQQQLPRQQTVESNSNSAAVTAAIALNKVLQSALSQAHQTVSTLPQSILQQLAVSQLVQNSLQKTIFGSNAAAVSAATVLPHMLSNRDALTNHLLTACLSSSQQPTQTHSQKIQLPTQSNSTQNTVPSMPNTQLLQQQQLNAFATLIQQQLNPSSFSPVSITSNNAKLQNGLAAMNYSTQQQQINMFSNSTNAMASSTEMSGLRNNVPVSNHQQQQIQSSSASAHIPSIPLVASPSQPTHHIVSRKPSTNAVGDKSVALKSSPNLVNTVPELTSKRLQTGSIERSKEEKDTATMLLSILSTLKSNHNEAMQNLAANDERVQRAAELGPVNTTSNQIDSIENRKKDRYKYRRSGENSRCDSSDNSEEVIGSRGVVSSCVSGMSEVTGKTDGISSGTNTSTTLSSSANGSDSSSASDDRRLAVDGGSETIKTDQSQSSGASGSSEDEDISDHNKRKGNRTKGVPLKKRRKALKDSSTDSGSQNSTSAIEFTSRNIADHNVRMDALQSSSLFEENFSRAKMGPSSLNSSHRGAN